MYVWAKQKQLKDAEHVQNIFLILEEEEYITYKAQFNRWIPPHHIRQVLSSRYKCVKAGVSSD